MTARTRFLFAGKNAVGTVIYATVFEILQTGKVAIAEITLSH